MFGGALLSVSLLVGLAMSQGPVMQSCSWRLVPLNVGGPTVEFGEVTCTFDQALYLTVNSRLVKGTTLSGMKVTTSTYSCGPNCQGTSTSFTPELTYYLGGVARMCCGTACASSANQVYIGPQTTTSFLNFLASFSKIVLPSSPSPNTLTFFIIMGAPGQPVPAGGLGLDAAKACPNLKFEYGYQTMAACQTAFPTSVCAVKSQGDVAAALNQMAPLGAATTGTCSPSAVQSTVALMNQVLDRTLPNINEFNQVGNIETVMGAFLSEKSLVACANLANSLFTLRNVTRDLTGSRDCPYDYETQKAQYDKDPCCAWFSTKCCAPRSVSRKFTEIANVVFSSVNTKCSADVGGALGNLRLIAQDLNQRATETTLGFRQLYDEYSRLSSPISTCLTDGFFGWAQECTKNGDCWSDDCDMSSAQHNQGKGRCQPSDKPYEDFLKCIYSATGLRPDIQRQLAADMGVTSAVRATRVAESATWLLANKGIRDCVGKDAQSFQASVTYGYDASGNYVPTVTPANEAGCLAQMACNHGYGKTQATCVQAPAQMCARCLGTYCYDMSWRYPTKAACETPKCKLPNEWRLRELAAAACRGTTACSQTCEKCVSGWSGFSNSNPTNYCFVNKQGGSCPPGSRTAYTLSFGSLCYLGDVSQANCTAQSGTYANCTMNTKAQCDQSTAMKAAMSCRWDQGAACTQSECAAAGKGECDDWDLQDYSCVGSQATCGRCVKPFPNVAGTMIVNDSYSACSETTMFKRYMRIGCGANTRSTLNYNAAACTAAGGTLKFLATTKAECEADKACIRWRSSRLPMTQAQCTECSNVGQQATWGTMYQWTTPTQLPGVVVNLQWINKTYGPVNRMVTTVPYVNLLSVAQLAVIKVLGRSFGSTLRKKYSTITQAYARLSCNCLSGGSAADTAECARLATQAVSVVVETCNCDASGACDDVCPFACTSACSYNVTRYPSAGYLNQNALRRRRRLQAGWAPYETIKDTAGSIIGQTIGNANAYAGLQNGQSVNLCLTIDQLIPQSPAYTLYDFAKGDGARNAPGAVMNLANLMPNGDQLCATVPAATYPYWPIKKLPPGGTRSPTSPTTPRPASPTTGTGGRVEAKLVVLAVASFVFVAFL